uniref:ABC transporter domain-containing protein n=1 Tax=Populus trichocarpa TaxID=3694 RepID=A0A2K1Y6Q9_POPTR
MEESVSRCHQEHYELVELASEPTANNKTIASFCRACIECGFIQVVSLCSWNIAHAVALPTHLVDKHQATFEDGIRSYQFFSLAVPSTTELWTLIPVVISPIGVPTPAFKTLERETEIEPDVPKSPDLEKIMGRIEFQNIQFYYPLRPEVIVLRNFSLQIEAGLKVALAGPSGSGKSSVLALLLRFDDPREGKVIIVKKDIREYSLRKLGRQRGWEDNIIHGNEGASETEIAKVSREANIHQFVCNLPDGYDRRAACFRACNLLLNEATNGLKTESERSILSALGSLNLNDNRGSYTTTKITVAHRLSTIVEMGSHSALIVDLTEYIRDYTSSRTRQKIDIPLPSQKSPYCLNNIY